MMFRAKNQLVWPRFHHGGLTSSIGWILNSSGLRGFTISRLACLTVRYCSRRDSRVACDMAPPGLGSLEKIGKATIQKWQFYLHCFHLYEK
jgi:hypothetical protein